MVTAADTNVLLDILLANSPHREEAARALQEAAIDGLVISDMVFAELAAHLQTEAALTAFLQDTSIALVPTSSPALIRAGNAWRAYRRRLRPGIECPSCGARATVRCAECGRELGPRQHVLADFLIGAHAVTHADRLLTRDRGFYASYFPDLTLV